MSEHYDFHYQPTGSGAISGQQVLQQTEDAINELGDYVNDNVGGAMDVAQQALETAQNAEQDAQTALDTANSFSDAIQSAQQDASSAMATAGQVKQQAFVFRYSSTALTPSSTNSNTLLDNTDNLKVGDKVIDSDGVLFSITAIDTQNSTFTIGTALIDLAQDSDVVHKSGNETISGNKTFSSINGVEPSSLSLPGYFGSKIDISSYITNLTGGNNNYTAPANGYVFIRTTNGTYLKLLEYPSGGSSTVCSQTADDIGTFLPVLSGRICIIAVKCSSIDRAYFIPCRGNV